MRSGLRKRYGSLEARIGVHLTVCLPRPFRALCGALFNHSAVLTTRGGRVKSRDCYEVNPSAHLDFSAIPKSADLVPASCARGREKFRNLGTKRKWATMARRWTLEERQRQAEQIRITKPRTRSTCARTAEGKTRVSQKAYKHDEYSAQTFETQ